MDVIVVGASDDHSEDVVGVGVLGRVDVVEVGEGLEDGVPVAVVFGFEVGPGGRVAVVHLGYYLWFMDNILLMPFIRLNAEITRSPSIIFPEIYVCS